MAQFKPLMAPLPGIARALVAMFLALLCVGATACSSHVEEGNTLLSQDKSLSIVASIFAPYDFARTIVGDAAEVSMLVPPGAETHSFEPTPADLMRLDTADVFIYVGGESDAWIEKTLASLDNPDLVLIKLVDIVETKPESALEDSDIHIDGTQHQSDEPDHAHHEEADEHVWTSLRNAETIVSSLAHSFAELDAPHTELFSDNASAYVKELEELDEHISQIVADAERTTLVFGDRFPFVYFADDYGLTCYAAFSGCSTAVDTNPQTIIFLTDIVRENMIPVVLYLELSDQRIARTIAEETGAQQLRFHAAHNISKEDFEAGATYISLMQANAETLEVALN